MGLQIPRCLHPEVPEKDALRGAAEVSLDRLASLPRIKRAGSRGHLMRDHVHMLISIPPKYSVSQVIGYIKGKSAIHLARVYGERKRNFVGQHFWARGYFVSTVGRDEEVISDASRTRRRKTSAWINCAFGTDNPPVSAVHPIGAALASPAAALSGSCLKAPGFAGGCCLPFH